MSTQFAPVCPLPIARQLAEADPEAFGNYHLLIATEVLKDPLGYNHFWVDRQDDVIILDNGVIEAGAALDVRLLAAAAVLVRADIVVVPDVIGDSKATMKAADETRNRLKSILPTGTELMGVIQAQTIGEAYIVNQHLRTLVDWIAVPKGYRERNVGDRATAAVTMQANHILGFSNNDLEDDLRAAREAGGIDSAVPIWLAGEGYTLDVLAMQEVYGMRRPEDYWDWQELNPQQLDKALFNIRMVRSWLNEGNGASL